MQLAHVIVLGTRNRKKAAELRELLEPHGFEVRTLDDFPDAPEVIEDGKSFAENARKKAIQLARHLGQWVIGEDSGLEVDALGGAPGIYSARFAGPQATDEQNNLLLLEKLSGVPLEKRTAQYVCHATLADPEGKILAEAEATCRGRIRQQPAGTAGFGYDPLFEIVEYHKTFGELGQAVKSVISHRARALRQLVAQILRLQATGN